ncbi:MAG: NADP-dependent oxidoreductase [Alphaproteobacteria bacterium]|jgi:hypothetical protein|nr:NADP-dependent oxidoreductase [Alphaproteobacteria bacterium]MDP6517971.1 NADP-dependent oxidoreductase [Alphaproteobacteria bacterium]
MTINHQVRLAARPVGMPDAAVWNLTEEPVPDPGEGEVVVKVDYVSIDPAMRAWINEAASYIPPVKIGGVMRALTAGTVVASRNPGFAVGDAVCGMQGVQDYGVSNGADLTKIDLSLAPAETWLGCLGIAGLTAYFGLLEVGAPKPGETVVVSGAAGSVGSTVGQIARIKGCRAVGIAGGPEKCRYLTDELGFEGAVDYKGEGVAEGLARTCADGIDVFFDNVGGETLDHVLARINMGARIVICGAISQYNNTTPMQGPSNYITLLGRRGRMQGFIYFDYAEKFPAAIADLLGWRAEGRLKFKDHIVAAGVEAFPDTLVKLFTGANFGKLMLKLPG